MVIRQEREAREHQCKGRTPSSSVRRRRPSPTRDGTCRRLDSAVRCRQTGMSASAGQHSSRHLTASTLCPASAVRRIGRRLAWASKMYDRCRPRQCSVQSRLHKLTDVPPGLPPPRAGITHVIPFSDPNATPVSSYRMRYSPAETEEARKQVDHSASNGFVRPSESPWGHSFSTIQEGRWSKNVHRLSEAECVDRTSTHYHALVSFLISCSVHAYSQGWISCPATIKSGVI